MITVSDDGGPEIPASATRPPASPVGVSGRDDSRGLSGQPVLVVGSGKGGVGKSLLSAMVATGIAGTGRRVLLVDGEQAMGNLHILLGIDRSTRLEDLLRHDTLPEMLLHPVTDSLVLLPSDSGGDLVYRLEVTDRAQLHYRLSTLYERFDAVVVDAGNGIESVIRAAAMQATRLVVITVPEPAAWTDAAALITVVHHELGGLPVDVLINRAADEAEGRHTFEAIADAMEPSRGHVLRYLGTILEHASLRAAAHSPRLLLDAPADAIIGPWLGALIQRLAPPAAPVEGPAPAVDGP